MDARTEEQVESWETRQVTGGLSGLGELAQRGFSGVVRARGAWLFMLNGRGVGLFGGTLDSFEDAGATAHLAPDPSLPLLFAMQEQGGSVEAKYYTNDTPLAEANQTLTSGNFTGYVELSENVLSGDYYVVYYGGRSMSCAFVGESERLLTGREAFERANDEVGIYEVRKVDVEVIDIPTPEPEDDPAAGEAADDPTAAGTGDEHPAEPAGGDDPPADEAGASDPAAGEGTIPADDPAESSAGGDPADGDAVTADAPEAGQVADAGKGSADDGDGTAGPAAGGDDEPVFTEEAEWQETRTIPSLNPGRSDTTAAAAATGGAGDRSTSTPDGGSGARSGTADARSAAGSTDAGGDAADAAGGARSRLDERETELAEAQKQLTRARGERDDLQRERDELRREVERLEAEVGELRSKLQRAHAGDGDAAGGEQLAPDEALSGTNFFVRYGTKGGGTLEKAHDGTVDREEVNTNLRLEHHTRFDADAVAVDGEPFETFLESSMEAGFVRWVVEDLLYEIRDTGFEGPLRDLFDAIPEIDRAELSGAVAVEYVEDGERYRDEVTLDVVMRDRMGNPLLVANLNDSRDPATDGMMTGLIEDAARVKATHERLSAAMFVTASFFQPEALETAEEATASGFLGRGKRASFVSESRSSGFHLCLVENRGGEFYVNVPDM